MKTGADELPPVKAGSPAVPAAVDPYLANAFHDHAARVRGSALRQTRDPELAADVTQEAFLRLVLEVRSGRIPDHVGAWLHRTATNLIVSHARHESVAWRHAPCLVSFDGPSQPGSIARLNEERDELRSALATVSPDERLGLVLAAHGVSGAEIARHLGRSHGATRTMVCRARGRMRLASSDVTACPRWPSATNHMLRSRPEMAARA